MYLVLSRSITWPFGWNSTKKSSSITDEQDQSPSLISNRDLLKNADLTKNFDETKSIIEPERMSILPPASALSALGKHYLTRQDLENLIQARFQQETPRDRVERFLWKDELGKYPASAQMKDWQCCSIALIVGCFFGMNRKEEMKPVYIRQTSMLKFQDRLTAERAFRQFNAVIFMKQAYRVALLVLFITETIMTSQYAIEAYRNKSTIYDCIPGGALVGFAFKALHSPLGAIVGTLQGGIMGFIYGFVHNLGCRLINQTYEEQHYEQVMQWILYRENAELWSANLEELPTSYVPPEKDRTWGLGWFKT